MRNLHYINAGLWLANAVTWSLYAGSWPMGLLSAAAAVGAAVIAHRTDTWRG